mmetsp:Transcript_3762/g.16392  ORF Transcript_3762/g.16392 Transcript_3762/m.16392 type:complete len:314 (-) Transcript_3762:1455-2396(-)
MKLKKRVRRIGGKGEGHGSALGDEAVEVGDKKRRKRSMEGSDEEDGKEEVLDAAMTMKVLKQAKAQLVSEGSGEEEGDEVSGGKKVVFDLSSEEEEDEEDAEEEELEEEEFDYLDETQITEEDERALAMFGMMTGPGRTIADIIQEKFEEAERKRLEAENPAPEDPAHAKVVEVYRGVGEVMKKYTTGKVPKAFKVIPNCANWEQLVWLTNPMEWSPASVFVATRVFASNLDEKQARKFYNEFLLPRARDDIQRYKKLHLNIYQVIPSISVSTNQRNELGPTPPRFTWGYRSGTGRVRPGQDARQVNICTMLA